MAAASQICGMAARLARGQNRRMTAPAPLDVYRQFQFLGVSPTGRRVCYDWVDMYRVTGGRIVWRYLLCDWKGLFDQLTARQASAQSDQVGR